MHLSAAQCQALKVAKYGILRLVSISLENTVRSKITFDLKRYKHINIYRTQPEHNWKNKYPYWSRGWQPCPQQAHWNWMVLKISFNSILWFYWKYRRPVQVQGRISIYIYRCSALPYSDSDFISLKPIAPTLKEVVQDYVMNALKPDRNMASWLWLGFLGSKCILNPHTFSQLLRCYLGQNYVFCATLDSKSKLN